MHQHHMNRASHLPYSPQSSLTPSHSHPHSHIPHSHPHTPILPCPAVTLTPSHTHTPMPCSHSHTLTHPPTHLYFHKVHGLHEAWFSREDTGIEHTSCGWYDLSSPTVDGVCVQRHIVDVEPDCSCILLAQCTLGRSEGV